MDLNPLSIALGGVDLDVVSADGAPGSTVKVRLLRVIEYPQFFACIDDAEKLAELVCARPAGWAATLAPASVLDITEKAMDLNFSHARRWAAQRVKLTGVMRDLRPSIPAAMPPSSASSAPTSAS